MSSLASKSQTANSFSPFHSGSLPAVHVQRCTGHSSRWTEQLQRQWQLPELAGILLPSPPFFVSFRGYRQFAVPLPRVPELGSFFVPAISLFRHLLRRLLLLPFHRGKTSRNAPGAPGGGMIVLAGIATDPSPRFRMRVANVGTTFGFYHSGN